MPDRPLNIKDRLIKGDPVTGETTKYRSLKYSVDKGKNDQPFIVTDIPELDSQVDSARKTTDFILREGSLLGPNGDPLNSRTAKDVERLGKFFTTPQGLNFAAKQNLLSAQNVKPQGGGILNQGLYLPTNTLAQAGVSALGGHLVKQGINPFRDLSTTPIQTPQVEGDGFLAAAGNFLSNANKATTFPLYLQNVSKEQESDNNRLVNLRDAKISSPVNNTENLGSGFGNLLRAAGRLINRNSRASQFLGKVNDVLESVPGGKDNNVSPNKNEILLYGGGPGSFQGIGNTVINRYTNTNAYDNESFRKKYYLLSGGQIQQRGDDNLNTPTRILPDFRASLISSQNNGEKKNILSNPVDYTRKNIEQRVGLGDPGSPEKNLSSYVNGSGLGPVDKVNSLPLYESRGVTANPRKNDLIKFRIAAPDTTDPNKKTYIHFRAFLEGFNDNYTSTWNETKYMGRTDSLYKFQGFGRDVVMSWKIAAQSREELMVMYTKLNYLQSLMAGDYTEKGYLAGNFINLTVGGYFWETPGIIKGMNIAIPEESPWEIGIPDSTDTTGFNSGQRIPTDKSIREMPHIIQVTGFSFTPIHKFAPRKQKNIYNAGGTLTEFGKQRFISLESEAGKSIYDNKEGENVRPDLQFNPEGFTDGSKPLQPNIPVSRGNVDQNAANITSPNTSEVNRALQGLLP